jgi:hypothetical protein
MTVEELFEVEKITLEMIQERSCESSYWDNVSDFIEDVWEKEAEGLTERQYDWVHRILEDMTEYRILNGK